MSKSFEDSFLAEMGNDDWVQKSYEKYPNPVKDPDAIDYGDGGIIDTIKGIGKHLYQKSEENLANNHMYDDQTKFADWVMHSPEASGEYIVNKYGNPDMISNDTLYGSISNNIGTGAAGVAKGVASFMGADEAANALDNYINTYSDKNPTEAGLTLDYLNPLNPHGITRSTANMLGSSLALLPVMLMLPEDVGLGLSAVAARAGGSKAVQWLAEKGYTAAAERLKDALYAGGQWATTALPEAISEGGNVRFDALRDGMSVDNAESAAWETAVKNLFILPVSNFAEGMLWGKGAANIPAEAVAKKFGYDSASGMFNVATAPVRAIPNAALGSIQNGAEEFYQQWASDSSLGKEASLNPFNGSKEQREAFMEGFFGGGPMAHAGGTLNAMFEGSYNGSNTDSLSNTVDIPPITADTQSNPPAEPPQAPAADIDQAAAPFIGQRMDNGANGCVEAVTKIGGSMNDFLKNELDNGVVYVPTLVSDAEKAGVPVIAFDPNQVSAGDIIVYGDNDHVVMADGNGGYVGNSTSQQKVVHGSDYTAMGDIQPTKIIKTGGNSVSMPQQAVESYDLDTDDMFQGISLENKRDIYDDFFEAALQNEIELPGISEKFANGKASDEEKAELVENNPELFLQYLEGESGKSDVELARKLADNFAANKDLKVLEKLQEAIANNDKATIAKAAGKYRDSLQAVIGNINQENNVTAAQPASRAAAIKATLEAPMQSMGSFRNVEVGERLIKLMELNNIPHNAEALRAGYNSEDPAKARSALAFMTRELNRAGIDVSQQPGRESMPAPEQTATENKMPLALPAPVLSEKPAETVPERQVQGQQLQQIADEAGVELPVGLSRMLAEGQRKAITAAQGKLVNAGITAESLRQYGEANYSQAEAASTVPIMEDVKGGNINENTTGTETASTEGSNTKSQNVNAKPEQGQTAAEESEVKETAHFEKGIHTDTRNGEKRPTAKIKGKVDKDTFASVKAVARKHGGGYSRFAKCFLFKTEAGRDDFVNEAERIVFGQKVAEAAQAETKKAADNGGVFSVDENIARGNEALQKVINTHSDVANAMNVDGIGVKKEAPVSASGEGYDSTTATTDTPTLTRRTGETDAFLGSSVVQNQQESKPVKKGTKDAYATAKDDTLELLDKLDDNAISVEEAKAALSVIKGEYKRSEPNIGDARKAESVNRLFREAEREIEKLEQAATNNETIFGDKAENDADMLEALGINPDELSDEILTAPEGIVNTAAERERLEKELMAELSKLSVNPVFNPKIYSLGLQIGMTYVKDGINTAKKLITKLNATFGDKIGSWAPAIAETISTWPKGVPFNEKQVMAVSKAIGSRFEGGMTTLDEIQADMAKLLKNRHKEFAPVIEASYNGIKKFYDIKEVETNEQQGQSSSTDGGSGSVQSREVGGTEKAGKSAGDTGENAEQRGQQGKRNSGSAGRADTEGAESGGVRSGAELEKAAGNGDSQRVSASDDVLTEAQKNPSPSETPGHDYEIKEAAAGKTSAKKRFEQNINAIKMLKKLETEGRMPTPSEQDILAAYNGWGGLKDAFIDGSKENKELKALLTDEEYKAARSTINDVFYTSPGIVRAIWEGVSRMGFKGGRVLDPSMGVGNFFGCMPREMMKKSDLRGVEIDSLTSRFSKMLYPSAYVENTGFEKSSAPDNFFDLVISNIPFGQFKIDGYNIHNYFFANGIDKVRPGGLMVFITSQGSLAGGQDAAKMRSYLAGKADMIAAYKLPSGAFGEAGTGVVTDIVIMQKRGKDNITSKHAQDFLSMNNVQSGYGYAGGSDSIARYALNGSRYGGGAAPINDYFIKHPENMLGHSAVKRNQYGEYAIDVTAKEGTKVEDELSKAMSKLPEGIYTKQTAAKTKAFDTTAANKKARADEKTRDLEYYMKDGKVFQNQDGAAVELKGKKATVVKDYVEVKMSLNALIIAQCDPKATDKQLDALRKGLNKAYDKFVGKHGYLNNPATAKNFNEDPSAGMVMALETTETTGTTGTGKNKKLSKVEKATIFTERTMQAVQEVTKADNPSDSLLASLSNRGEVDLDYMAGLLGSTPDKVAEGLKGQIFKNPMTDGYETREEYLSGNVREKLAHAKAAAKNDKAYEENVKALEKVIPEDLVSDEIIVNLGAPWIPVSDVEDFVKSIMSSGNMSVKYLAGVGQWAVDGWGNSAKYKTDGITMDKMLEHILNNKSIVIYKGTAKEKEVDQTKTDAANLIADQIRTDFREWLWKDKDREKRLVRYYNDNFNNSVTREYDGSHLGETFPGMNSKWKMRPHQQNVVWRMLQKANTLIAHCVGAGKTAEMQAAGMEMRRLGIAKKPMYCLPNNVVEQFAREFRSLYPNAKLLVLQTKDLPAVKSRKSVEVTEDGRKKKKKVEISAMPEKERAAYLKARAERNRTLARIQTEDWDAIIIPHTMFERFPLTPETANSFIQEQIDVLERTYKEAKGNNMSKRALSNLEDRIKSLKQRMEEMIETELDDIGIPFEQLGVDQLFVDEADLFKNLPFASAMDPVSGIGNPSSKRANDMFIKTQWLTRAMGGRGVVFATGTPISNTMAEMFTMMRYMDTQGLKEKGVELFDNWVRTFAEIGSGLERKSTGDGFRKVTKVLRFVNMPELTGMFRKFADVKNRSDLDLDVPELKNGKPTIVKIEADPELLRYIKEEVPKRLSNMKGSFKKEKGADNMLKLTGDLRKMSMTDTKIEACAAQIAKKYEETTDVSGAQLVFCDLGIPKAQTEKDVSDNAEIDDSYEQENASVYEKLMKAVTANGVPAEQVAFVQSAKNKAEMDELFQKVDKGELRILIGSTQKMGAGTNCQHHLVALHHLDAPWRPRDIEQREGRIIRQGNENKQVEIFNYVVQDSFDANMWEKLKNKASIIAQAMSGNTAMRAVEDADLVTLSYAEVEGAATGNPLIKEQLDLNNQVTKYANAQTAFKRKQRDAQADVDTLPKEKELLEIISGKVEADIKARKDTKGDAFTMKVGDKVFTERTKAEAALNKILEVFTKTTSMKIGEIGGFDLKAVYSKTGWSIDGEAGGGVKLQLVHNQAYSVNANSIQGIEKVLQGAPEKKLTECREKISHIDTRLKEADEILNQESPYAEKLKQLQQRLVEVNREIEQTLVEGSQQKNEPVTDPETGEIIGEAPETASVKYSVSESSQKRTADEWIQIIRDELPTATSIKVAGDVVTVKMPNGGILEFNLVDKIFINKAAASKAYDREIGAGDKASGSIERIGKNAIITLTRDAKASTVSHEAYHYAEDVALSQKEKDFLVKRMPNGEARAIEYENWRDGRKKSGMPGKLFQKILDTAYFMLDLVGVRTKYGIYKRIESGEVYLSKNKKQFDNYSVNVDNDVKYQLNEKQKQRIFEIVSEDIQRNIDRLSAEYETEEIRQMLREENSSIRESVLRQFKRIVADFTGRKDAHAKELRVKQSYASLNFDIPEGLDYEKAFESMMRQAKEVLDYAGQTETTISLDRGGNDGLHSGLSNWREAEREATRIAEAEKERLGEIRDRQIEEIERRRQGNNQDAFYDGVRYSISPSDNSTESWVKKIKNRFFKVKSKDYRIMQKNMLEELADVKIKWGNLDEGTVSIYKETEKVIRVKERYDWARVLPHVGKAVANQIGLEPTAKMQNYIADWIFTGAPNNTSIEASMFAEAMRQYPVLSEKLYDVQSTFLHWNNMDVMQRISHCTTDESDSENRKSFRERRTEWYDHFTEELGPVKRMVEAIEKQRGEKLLDASNPYNAFRLFRGHYGKAMTMVEGEGEDAVNALQNVFPHVNFDGFKTLYMIMEEAGVLKDKQRRSMLMNYCYACHVNDIHKYNDAIRAEIDSLKQEKQKIKAQIDSAKAKSGTAEAEQVKSYNDIQLKIDSLEKKIMATPWSKADCEKVIAKYSVDFGNAQQDIVHYSNVLSAIAHDAGLITDKHYDRLLNKWPNYVPMFRVFEENEDIKYGDSLKELKGSAEKLDNLFGSLISNTYTMIKRAEKNKAKLILANLARCTDVGKYIEEIEVKGKPDLGTIVGFYENGKRKYLETGDPSIARAINSMGVDDITWWTRLLKMPAKIARACLTTINPSFAARNVSRDIADGMIYSKYGFTPWDFVRGFVHAIKKDEVFYEWMASGAAQASAVSIDRNYTKSTIDKMTKTWKQQMLSSSGWLDTLQKLGEWSEYGTRIGAYERAKNALGNKANPSQAIAAAALESRDLMDFARGGKSSRQWNHLVVFANASIQGLDKFFRTFDFKNNRKEATRALARLVLTAMVPALCLALAHGDEDWYKELPDWLKESHWIIGKVGDNVIRIPKGQDLGIRLFSNFIEKAVAHDKNIGKSTWNVFYDSLPNILPTALLPVFEAGTNYSMFTGRPVVPGYLQKLPDEAQYNYMTSGIAKFIGKNTGLSPMKVDHVINGYFGNMGRTTLQIMDYMARDNKSTHVDLPDMPIIGGMFYMPYKNPKSVQRFYEDLDEQTKFHNLYKHTGERAEGYDEGYYKRLTKANTDRVQKLNKKERMAVNDQRLSMQRRYEIQRDIQQRRINAVKGVLKD